ncbi:MAG: carboxymuconolactone decarboxylase family protein [Acidobacteriota bacterium]
MPGPNKPLRNNESKTEDSDDLIPRAAQEPTTSYSMLEPRMKKLYGAFYKELYYVPERRVLDPKVQELISISVSLATKCEGCLDGHIKKALALGATKEEISEAISIAIAINAASIVDQSDQAAARLGLDHFPSRMPKPD